MLVEFGIQFRMPLLNFAKIDVEIGSGNEPTSMFVWGSDVDEEKVFMVGVIRFVQSGFEVVERTADTVPHG